MKNTKHFLLSALLGLAACCAATAAGVVKGVVKKELNEGWTFKQVRGHNWYRATVPGVVHTDLMDNGLIDDPFFRLNERNVQWIDKEDWEYRTTIDVPGELFRCTHLRLRFCGLDTYADVYLNDSLIVRADNMFREWTADVKPLLKKQGNRLRVYFHSPLKIDLPKWEALPYRHEAGNDQSENGGMFDRKVSIFARKAGYHYGWDWGPRLVTSGIWRPVYLEGWNEARIADIFYRQDQVSRQQADLTAVAEIEAGAPGEATLSLGAEGLTNTWKKTVRLRAGINRLEIPVTVKQPALWWSNGLGEPHLYIFRAALAFDGRAADERETRVGLRSLKVINRPDSAGHTFYFELNGTPVFMKGANYIPGDNFLPRVNREKYEKTIRDAVDANMNMLRVWGGGIYENDVFYELCDRYGILVWQDFMFACNTYPAEGAWLENVRREAAENIRRLRNHPCIALWCGNNECHTAWFNWGWQRQYRQQGVADEMRSMQKELFHHALAEAVVSNDPTAFYWPSSPYGGRPDDRCESGLPDWNPDGDGHYWGVWHGKDSIANYNHVRSRFFSEYGFQAFPEYQSVLQYAPDSCDHSIRSDVMMAHQRGGSHANDLIEWYLLNEYGRPKDFRQFLYLGLLLQGDAIKTAIEAHRRDMPYCMGSLFWQHNDCWPVASWSSRDYYGRWKAQHYFARKAFADVLVSPVARHGILEVHVVSDRLKPVEGELDIRITDLKGNPVSASSRVIAVPANASRVQFAAPLENLLKGKNPREVVVHAAFTARGEPAVTNNYFLTRFKEIDFPRATIATDIRPVAGGFDVTLTSDVFARGVYLWLEGIDYFFSDNYFDLMPGEAATVRVSTSLDRAAFARQLHVQSLCDAY